MAARADGMLPLGPVAEDVRYQPSEEQVESAGQRHHDDHEDQYDRGVAEQFLTGRSHNLLELDHDLAQEQGDAGERPTLVYLVSFGAGDDILAGFVDAVCRHSYLPSGLWSGDLGDHSTLC
jgi:hypothetical protein